MTEGTTPGRAGPGGWRPLTGITVLDFTRMLPGGTATMVLADLGARVIKIEHPPRGDETRWLAPRVGTDSSVQHQYLDRGKESVFLDLKSEDGRAEAVRLAGTVDAVIESFRPGVADRLGVGYTDLLAVQPRLVYLSLSGYGADGPKATEAGHDLNFWGSAGLLGPEPDERSAGPGADAVNGGGTPDADSDPALRTPTVLGADMTGGTLAALALVAGVQQARTTGAGVHLDLALADAALYLGGQQIAERLGSAELGEPVQSPLLGSSPCYNLYRCSDGLRIAVAAVEPKFWARTATLVGHPDWAARQFDRSLIPEVRHLFAGHPRGHWVDLLVGQDTCVTAVLDIADLPADPGVLDRGSLVRAETAAGEVWQVAPPVRTAGVHVTNTSAR
ncbi:CoA transferase [Nakamurella sp. YIM 132087]|uniref:CoA transferase n=1 Tax=Nakamurella alba TaxID=2665158 RepID=A0A7K1FIB3_9ACTN|nr:CoA transferase [Nakamurella alba]MTD13865.1 CoA transferase [Nakamurella alba]